MTQKKETKKIFYSRNLVKWIHYYYILSLVDADEVSPFLLLDDVSDVYKLQKKYCIFNERRLINCPLDIIKKISNISEENIRYEIKNNEFFEIKNSLISNKKLIDKYKLFPKFNIEDGLKMTLENYKKIWTNIRMF